MGDIPYNMIYTKGDRLVLHLTNSIIFEGDYSDGGTNYINLINARQHNNPNALGGVYSFDRNEIESIYTLNQHKVDCINRPIRFDRKNINLTEEEYNRLREMSVNYVYIQRADYRYYKSVQKLWEAENIGIIPMGMELSRFTQIKLLALCTWKEVFLFDIIHLKNNFFYPELKEILESEYICKVMHSGGPLIDILSRNYKVNVQNTFDTQVVDLILQKRNMGNCPNIARSLSQCLTEYLNLPHSFLEMAVEACNKSWRERPLRDDQLSGAAQQVTYLIVLKHQMEKKLLSKTYNTICKVHTFYSGLQNFEFSDICHNQEISEAVAQLIPSLDQLK